MLVKSRILRFFLVTAIFVVAGPPIGGIVAWTSMTALNHGSPLQFIAGSYGDGVLIALSTGLLVAFAGLWLAMQSWKTAVVAALASNAIFIVLTADLDLSRADYLSGILRVGRFFLLPSLVAALACWAVVRPLLGGAASHQPKTASRRDADSAVRGARPRGN